MESDLTKTKPSHTAGKHANPWKQWIARANRGDERAALNFFAGVEPIVREFCRIPYFRDNLDINEICGISNHKLTEFLKRAPHIRTDEEVPCVLKTVLRNTLLRSVKQHKTHCKMQQPCITDTWQKEAANTITELLPADSSLEPEALLLRNELTQDVKEALKQLKPLEQKVIRGLYYEGKNNKALANDMNITPQYVSLLKRKGLSRMKKLLKIKYPEQDILK